MKHSVLQLLDLTKLKLDFSEPDFKRFPLLKLAYDAGIAGGAMPAVLNAANETAVDAFLKGRLKFYRLPEVIIQTVEKLAGDYPVSAGLDLSVLLDLLGLRIERLAELHDVEAALTQRRPDRGRRIGSAGRHLQFEESSDFFRHLSLLLVVRILTVGDRLTFHVLLKR